MYVFCILAQSKQNWAFGANFVWNVWFKKLESGLHGKRLLHCFAKRENGQFDPEQVGNIHVRHYDKNVETNNIFEIWLENK